MKNKLQHIRKVTATCFFAMFMFILAEKALHSHNNHDQYNLNKETVSITKGCSICDFQIGKDAQPAEYISCTGIFPLYNDKLIDFSNLINSVNKDDLSGRGPPVL